MHMSLLIRIHKKCKKTKNKINQNYISIHACICTLISSFVHSLFLSFFSSWWSSLLVISIVESVITGAVVIIFIIIFIDIVIFRCVLASNEALSIPNSLIFGKSNIQHKNHTGMDTNVCKKKARGSTL